MLAFQIRKFDGKKAEFARNNTPLVAITGLMFNGVIITPKVVSG